MFSGGRQRSGSLGSSVSSNEGDQDPRKQNPAYVFARQERRNARRQKRNEKRTLGDLVGENPQAAIYRAR